ncbi:MAG: methyltransferase domain-containing protein [Caldilineaceae bacterium]|nr:methyltransferase domain-containing protein [Caldilineaceae bacterium]
MSNQQTGQVIRSAAEIYDEFFVPALFAEWAEPVANAAQVALGQQVLDVACGTGVLTRAVHQRVQPGGTAIGLDINDGMLSVARQKTPAIDFREGNAQDLPFNDAQFDAVVSQFALMFFTDRVKAIQEMMRVLRPGGHLAVAVWDTVNNVEGYAALSNLMDQLYGQETGDAVRSPFVLGDVAQLRALFAQAGVDKVELLHDVGVMRFPSLRDWLTTEIRGWILADKLTDDQFEEFMAAAEPILAPFVTTDGSVALKAPAHIVTLTK